jgi:DNA polymerase-3 subunit beta
MKFTIDQRELERVLSELTPFLDKNNDSFRANYYLIAKDNTLTIQATNLKIGLSVIIRPDIIEQDGSTLVDGARFLKVVKSFKRDSITCELISNELLVKQGRSKFKVKVNTNTKAFYTFPTSQDMSKVNFNGQLLKSGFETIIPSIDGNSPKYELTGGLVSISEKNITFVSTDTKRLTIVEETLEEENSSDLEFIIPRPAMIEIPKLFDGDIEFLYNEEFVIIENKEKFFFTKLVSGTYPVWKRIVPKELAYEFSLNKIEIIEKIKLISSVSSSIKISFTKKGITFKTLDYQNVNSEAETFIEMELTIPESFELGTNSRFIMDFLNHIDNDSEEFTFGFNKANRPFVLLNKNIKSVIMPINIDGE